MLQAAYVLISLAHGDKDEFDRTHRVNREGRLNGNTNDGATAPSGTRDREDMEVSARRVSMKEGERNAPNAIAMVGMSPKTAAPSSTRQNHLESACDSDNELDAIESELTHLALRLDALKRLDCEGRVRPGMSGMKEKSKEEKKGRRRGKCTHKTAITECDMPAAELSAHHAEPSVREQSVTARDGGAEKVIELTSSSENSQVTGQMTYECSKEAQEVGSESEGSGLRMSIKEGEDSSTTHLQTLVSPSSKSPQLVNVRGIPMGTFLAVTCYPWIYP